MIHTVWYDKNILYKIDTRNSKYFKILGTEIKILILKISKNVIYHMYLTLSVTFWFVLLYYLTSILGNNLFEVTLRVKQMIIKFWKRKNILAKHAQT